jgi:hypothetical protein
LFSIQEILRPDRIIVTLLTNDDSGFPELRIPVLKFQVVQIPAGEKCRDSEAALLPSRDENAGSRMISHFHIPCDAITFWR